LGNRIEHVRGRDEEHFREIERHIKIVVAERRILLRIKRFQQSRARVATEIASYLVNFVEHKDGIFCFCSANALNNLARQGTDVCAAMAANLGLVVNTAQRNTDELAPQGPSNRTSQ